MIFNSLLRLVLLSDEFADFGIGGKTLPKQLPVNLAALGERCSEVTHSSSNSFTGIAVILDFCGIMADSSRGMRKIFAGMLKLRPLEEALGGTALACVLIIGGDMSS